jgi:hypothetical protein
MAECSRFDSRGRYKSANGREATFEKERCARGTSRGDAFRHDHVGPQRRVEKITASEKRRLGAKQGLRMIAVSRWSTFVCTPFVLH